MLIKFLLDFLNYYSDGILALSAFVAAIAGIFGIDVWKKKMKGKLDHDIARKFLKSILELRDATKIVRSPFIPVSEMYDALKNQGMDEKEIEDKLGNNKEVYRAVYSLRWNKLQKVWFDLESISLEAEVSWGKQVVDVQKKLDEYIRELRSVVWLFVNYPESFNKKHEENRKILYGTYDENDKYYLKIENEISKIKEFLEKYL